MTVYIVNTFGGMSPKISARQLNPRLAVKAVNVSLTTGELAPLRGPLKIGNAILSKAGVKLSIYKFGQDLSDETQYWFHWLTNVNVVRGNFADDAVERTYFTGDGVPKITYSPNAVTGGTNYPYGTYTLGVIKPDLLTLNLSVSNRAVTSITFAGTIATATTALPHKLQSNTKATIFGASDALYNGIQTVIVINATQFSYVMTAAPAANASGTLSMNYGGLPESRVYAFAYVSALGEEGAPSISSGFLSVIAGQIVSITGMPTSPSGNYNYTRKRIYRVLSGTNKSALQVVGEVTLSATSFTDDVLSTQLDEVIESLTYEPPPSDLKRLIAFSNGMMAGISGNQVCISEPFAPHAYPIGYRYSLTAVKPIALGSFGQSIVVLTNGMPSILTGSSPQSMNQDEIKFGQPCLSAESTVEIAGGVMWASDEGLAFIGNNGFDLATKQLFTVREWALYYPKTIRGHRWQNRYVGFYDTGTVKRGFIFDALTTDFYELDFYATAGYTDPKNGNLYLAIGDDVFKFDAGTNLKQLWLSKEFENSKLINMAVAKVVAKDYPVTFKLFASGNLKFTKQVQDGRIFSLPSGYKSTNFQVELSGNTLIQGFGIAESTEELKSAVE